MADPIVTITNGIPVSSVPATGTITTLGQTLVDGANVALGATTDAAATGVGTVNAHLRSIATNISGGITISSGTITVSQGSPPWTVKPDGTVWTLTSTSANVNVTNGSIAVTGTFFQATQPISAAALPLPSGASTSAKQPALGTAGAASADVITVQGIASMTALKVDGSAVTQPVSGTVTVTQGTAANLNATVTGTVTANQGGTWTVQPGNTANTTAWLVTGTGGTFPVTGTITANQGGNWTTRIVGNAAGVLDFAGQNATAPANAILVGGEFNTTPTTITSGNASPFQLDSAGNLLVNVKAGGGSGGTSSTFGAAFPGTGTAIGAKDSAGTNMQPLNLDASGNLKVAVTGAGSGGTSAVDEAAFTAGTSAFTPAGGFFQTTATNNALTNGQMGAWQMTAQRAGFVNLRNASGTEIGTSTTPLRDAPDGTVWTLTGTSANVNVTNSVTISGAVTGSSATAPVSTMNSASANSGTTAAMAACFDDVSPTAITENNFGYIRMSANRNQYTTIRDAAGNERGVNVTAGNALVVDGSGATQPVSGTVTANQGGTWTVQPGNTANTTAWLVTGTGGTFPVTGTIAATQSGNWTSRIVGNAGATLDTSAAQNQTMPTNMLVIGGEFNTTPTAITSGNASPLQLNGSGSLRVDGSGVTQPVSGTVTAAQATAANLNATVVGTGTFAVQAAQSGTWTVQQGTPPWLVGGDVASGSADSGNPVKVGAVARTANPTAVTTGQRVNLMADKLGKLVAVGALRDLKGRQKTSITVNTATTVVTAGAAGVFNDVYAIVITNKSVTSVTVDINDGAAVVMTLAAPAGDTRGFTVPVDSAIPQSGAAAAWTATVSTAVTSIEITMLFVSNI